MMSIHSIITHYSPQSSKQCALISLRIQLLEFASEKGRGPIAAAVITNIEFESHAGKGSYLRARK